MDPRKMEMSLALVLVTIFWSRAAGQLSCTSVILSLSPCLSYVLGNSTTPSSSCCSQLATVVQSQPRCLCSVIDGGGSLGISVNRTQALALPGACKVTTPPVSQCNAAGGPATSPVAESPTETAAPRSTAPDFSSPTPPMTEVPSVHSPIMPPTPSVHGIPPVPSPTMPTTPSVSNIPSGSGSKATPSMGGSGDSSNGSSTKFSLSVLFIPLFLASYASSTITNFGV